MDRILSLFVHNYNHSIPTMISSIPNEGYEYKSMSQESTNSNPALVFILILEIEVLDVEMLELAASSILPLSMPVP